MHGNSPEFVVLVNAEVDSMGGVIDGGVGIDSKISPRRAAIDMAQAQLRVEYDVREERRRELEFLEKGGNPLDFKLGPATSISVQSTSVADQFVTSEAKDSFPLTASPRGDSVESSGRPGAALVRDTNTADNLLLFDGENDTVEGERNSKPRSRSNIAQSEQVSQMDGYRNVQEPEDTGMLRFVVKNQAYARRNRSRSSRDSVRGCSTDFTSVSDRNGSSVLRSRPASRDTKGIVGEASVEKDQTVKSVCNLKSTNPNGHVVGKNMGCDNQLGRESDVRQSHGTASDSAIVGEGESDVAASKRLWGRDHQQRLSVDADKRPKPTASMTTDNVGEKEGVSFARIPLTASAMVENVSTASQCNGFGSNVNEVDMLKEGGNHSLAFDVEGIVDPESCIQNGLGVNGNTSIDQIPTSSRVDSPRNSNKEIPLVETSTHKAGNSLVKEKSDIKGVEVHAEINDRHKSVSLNSKNSGSSVKVEEETGESRPGMKNELKFISNLDKLDHNDHVVSNTDGKTCDLVVNGANVKSTGSCPQVRRPSTTGFTNSDQPEVKLSGRGLDASELQIYEESQLKLAKKMHEDSIMEEARSIEAKRKRIAELSVRNYPSEYRRKSHWDFVLEEMAWLANDFMQERLWKTSAASQISHMAASNGRLRISKRNECCGPKQIAHTLTKAIMQFWRSAEEIFSTNPSIGLEECTLALVGLQKVDRDKVMEDKIRDNDVEASRHMEEQNTVKCHRLAVQEYAVRFLKYSSSFKCAVQAEAPKTPDRLSDLGIVDIFMEDRFSEEILFYTAPPGAMEAYRKSVENYWSQYEKTGGSTHTEEVETSIYGASEELGTRDNLYEEDEGEAGAYYFPGGFEASKLSKSAQKKRKNLQKSYARSYDVGADLPYGQFVENKVGTQNSLILGKRPPNNLNVGSIPIKRVRTASRQRVVSAGVAGGVQIPCKADASSGDTSSYQDDQSIVHGGSHIRKTLEVESTGDYGEQLPFDCTEVSMKPRKKKKAKHLLHKNSLNSTENGGYVIGKGPPYEQRWQLDSMVENEQRDYSKKRLGSHVFESNGNSGVFGQHATKRPKILKQLQDTSESITPVAGTVPSPVASQMSNMSNPNKFMKMITGRDRGRKIKALKTPAGQSGSGSPWSLFEDQALVVLVHDMGPNWELVSDAISSTLQFKCIYRNPKECKERHKILMDRNAGDGADSAEDSGSSQPYTSTLPGIPKGSARQLFQRLQGPMEEDTLKSHFEKIIMSVQKQHPRRTQSDKQGTKLVPVHNSHIAALSQVSPNNLSGGILTPLDLCDTTTSSSDLAPLAYQGSHSSGLPISNQGPTPPVHPTSGANSMLQGSAAIVHDNSLPSPSAAFNTSSRDGQRYGVPRPASVSNNENQKMQPYNQMLPSKSIQLSGVATPGSLPSDRGVRMLPGANNMGMMTGIRGMTMPRPGFQGIGSPAMLNMVSSGTMLSSSGVGIPNPVNMHNGAVSGQGNSMMRTREALHMNMMRAPDEQRQLMMQELQMQVTQGNSQGIPPFNGLSSGYTSQTVSPPSQTFPVQHPQQHQIATQQPHVLSNNHHSHLQGSNHTATPQQQAYLLRIAKERQLHQRAVHQHNQQQQHQFASSNTTMTHVQPQSQHPVSSSLQNSSQIQQASSQPVSVPPPNVHHPLTSSSPMNPVSSQSQQKQLQMAAHGLVRNPQAVSGNLPNQILKQRQRQQQQQQQHPGRHHPQQRQQSQPQQQAKLVKGMGRGNIVMHQNISLDASHVNGLTMAAGNQVAEKGEQVMHLLQGQSLFSGSGSTAVQTSKPLVPQPSSSSQQKLFSRSPPSSSKQVLQMPSSTDNSNQGQVHPVSSGNAQQPVLPLAMPPHQQQSLHRQASQSQQTIHRLLPQNRQASSDSSIDQVNQLPVNDTFHMSTSTDSTSVVPVASSSTPPQWKAQEPFYDASTPNAASQLASIGNPSLPSSSGDEPITLHSQGISQRQFSGGIPIHNQNVQTQWQPQKQPLLQSSQQSSPPLAHPPPPSQQPQLQSQAQPQQPPQQHSPQNSQVEQGGLCVRPTNSGPG